MERSTKKVAVVVAIVAVLLAALYVLIPLFTSPQPTLPLATVTISSPTGPVQVVAEVADDSIERARGLMFRENLAEDAGMLFIFQQERPVRVWMKDTLIPLDVLFINSALTVVSIVEGMPPCEADPCPSYSSEVPTLYALEVNAEFVQRHDIRVGAEVSIET